MKIPLLHAAACALLATTVAAHAQSAAYDLVLSGGRVMDPATGLDAPRNVAIRAGKIAALSEQPLAGVATLKVAGLVVAPGFIDLHAHGQTTSDMEIQARDGVTTALDLEVGVYPVDSWYRSMEGKAPLNYGATVSHIASRFSAFHPGLEIGHWAINRPRVARLGANPAGANKPAGPAELEAMAKAFRRGLDEGALGIGFGINYTPAAEPGEIEASFRIAAERKVPAFVHTRAFGLAAIEEALAAAKKTGASLHIVHIGSSGIDELPQALQRIDASRAAGLDVTTEVYPYTAASTMLESAMFNPGWQANLKVDYGDLAWAATGERLTAESFERYRKQGGWVIIYMMKDENVERAIAHPGVMIASDGVPFIDGKGHPRGAGTFARVLGRYSREKKLLPLMEALAKMTILPARRLEAHVPAMRNKGRLAVGADADLTVFDPATVIDRATFEAPTTPSAGIPHVLVNGTFVVRDGELVRGALPGRAVRAPVAPEAALQLRKENAAPDPAINRAAFQQWQERTRAELREALGIPKTRVPLAPEKRGETEHDGTIVERWIFTSEAGSRVPAVLYRPKQTQGRLPAIVFTYGHGSSKSSWSYDYAAQVYAKLGIACLAIDPIGEEERNRQGRTGTRAHDSQPVHERAQKAGRLIMGKLVFDTMRAIDFLETRGDIDPAKIGVAGYSLGGAKASWMAALEPRIKLAIVAGWAYDDATLPTKFCTRVPNELMRARCTWSDFAALAVPHCAVLVPNGEADVVIDRAGDRSAWRGTEAALAQVSGYYAAFGAESAARPWIEPAGGHRPYFVYPVALEWIQRHFRLPAATLERIRATPGVNAGDWCDRHGIQLERLYGTALHWRGATLPDFSITPTPPTALKCLAPGEIGQPQYTLEGWLEQIEKNAEHPPARG